jgi:processive 1,2-diacylglycerol beta-glucosyltransferase
LEVVTNRAVSDRRSRQRPPALAWKIDRLLDDPARLAALRTNARRLARPHAARDIAVAPLGTDLAA